MSWKSFVTTGMLCIIASPAFAAPTVSIVPGGTAASGHLNASGDWVWRIRLAQSSPIVDVDNAGPLLPGSPLGAELGFRELLGEMLTAANLNDGFDFSTNPGNGIFGWEVLTDTDGDGSTGTCGAPPCTVGDPLADPDDEPVGVQISTALDEAFSALGSVDYLSDADGKNYIQITVDGPTSTSLSTQLQMLGDYGGNGRIAELNDAFDPALPTGPANPFSINHDNYAVTFTRTARNGDLDLNGNVGQFDFGVLATNFGGVGDTWLTGDFNGDGTTGQFDFGVMATNFGQNYVVGAGGTDGGAGAGGGGAVPEPATMALFGLGSLMIAGLYGRRRS